jgi:hypothetical protein
MTLQPTEATFGTFLLLGFWYLSFFSLYLSGRVNVSNPNMTIPLPEFIQTLAGISSGKEFLHHTQNNKKNPPSQKMNKRDYEMVGLVNRQAQLIPR